jgi:hypothetical protein
MSERPCAACTRSGRPLRRSGRRRTSPWRRLGQAGGSVPGSARRVHPDRRLPGPRRPLHRPGSQPQGRHRVMFPAGALPQRPHRRQPSSLRQWASHTFAASSTSNVPAGTIPSSTSHRRECTCASTYRRTSRPSRRPTGRQTPGVVDWRCTNCSTRCASGRGSLTTGRLAGSARSRRSTHSCRRVWPTRATRRCPKADRRTAVWRSESIARYHGLRDDPDTLPTWLPHRSAPKWEIAPSA